MNSPTWNIYAMAILGTLLVTFGVGVLSDIIFAPDESEAPGYVIEVAEAEGAGEGAAEEAAEATTPLPVLLASADPAAGEDVAKKCVSCHTFEQGGPNKIGPNLWNVVNRPIASVQGFSYSPALVAFAEGGKVWDWDQLDGFLENPRGHVPGTAMSFAGIKQADDRAAILAYMRTLSDAPAPLPEATQPTEEIAAEEAAPAEGTDQATEGAPEPLQGGVVNADRPMPPAAQQQQATVGGEGATGGEAGGQQGAGGEQTAAPAQDTGASEQGTGQPAQGADQGQPPAAGAQPAAGEQPAGTGGLLLVRPRREAAAPQAGQPAGQAALAEQAGDAGAGAVVIPQAAPQTEAPAQAAPETEAAAEPQTTQQVAQADAPAQATPAAEAAAQPQAGQQTAQAEGAAQPAQPPAAEPAAGAPAAADLPPAVALVASADPAAGERGVRRCAACHTFEEGGPNKIGPNLWGVVNRPIASHEGYEYSEAMAAFAAGGKVWDYTQLDAFIANPKGHVPGTKMVFAGIRKDDDRAAMLAYLRTLAAEPAPLPGASQ